MSSSNGPKLIIRHTRGSVLAGQQQEFSKPVISLGRKPGMDVAFGPNDTAASSEHAQLRIQDGAVFLSDLSSTNGTFVNGQRISAPTPITSRDRITFGQNGPEFTVELKPDQPAGMDRTIMASPAAAAAAAALPRSTPAPATRPASQASQGKLGPAYKSSIGMNTLLNVVEGVKKGERKRHLLTTILLLLVIGCGAGVAAWTYWPKASVNTTVEINKSTDWSAVFKKIEPSIYQVQAFRKEGDKFTQWSNGTAWSVKPGLLATNAHVAELLQLSGPGGYLIARRGGNENTLRITKARLHPGYVEGQYWGIDFLTYLPEYGQIVALGGLICDVALLEVHPDDIAKQGEPLKLAEPGTLAIGQAVCCAGFPTEGTRINWDNPSSHHSIGHINRLMGIELDAVNAENVMIVGHDLNILGGSSGSAMVNEKGEVVAVANAGDDAGNMGKGRIALAGFNYGIPVRFVHDLLSDDLDGKWKPLREGLRASLNKRWRAGVDARKDFHRKLADGERMSWAAATRNPTLRMEEVKSDTLDVEKSDTLQLIDKLPAGEYVLIFNIDRPGPTMLCAVVAQGRSVPMNKVEGQINRLLYFGGLHFSVGNAATTPTVPFIKPDSPLKMYFGTPEGGPVKVAWTVYQLR